MDFSFRYRHRTAAALPFPESRGGTGAPYALPANSLFRSVDTLNIGILASDEFVEDYEILPLTDDECYCFLSGETGPASRALFENFTRGSP